MALTISNPLVPMMHINIDNSEATQTSSIQALKTLMVGQQLATATTAQKTMQRITNGGHAGKLFGVGSHMHNMALVWFQNNKQTELYGMAFDDGGADVAATGTITVVGTATEDEDIILYVAGKRLTVPVLTADTATDMAGAMVTAITAETSLPVTATNVAGVVTVTARHKGVVGNQVSLLHGHFENEDELPAGVTSVTVVAMGSGTGTQDIDEVFTAIGDERFHLFLHSLNDATNIGKLDVQLTARNDQAVKSDGYAITCITDTVTNVAVATNAHNSEFNVIVADIKSASDSYQIAAAVCAQIALEGSLDPARPFQTLTMHGTIAANKTGRTTADEQQVLLAAGAATFTVDRKGDNAIQRIVTTYKTDEYGDADASYLDLNTLLSLSTYRGSFDALFAKKYPRHKLADDGTRSASNPSQSVITPSVAKAEAIAHFITMEELGIVEGLTAFMESIIVTRNADDRNRLDFVLRPDVINQFRIAGVEIKFIL